VEVQIIGSELLAKAISYEDYFEELKRKAESSDTGNLSEYEIEKLPSVKINYQRVSRIHRTYKVDEAIEELISRINAPQTWVVITENWCGDSAQNLPYIVEIAKINPIITLKIILRDNNLELMDMYLTNGTRSIPKLIVLDKGGEEIFQWGPRPVEGQEVVNRLKSEGKSKEEFLEQLHLWYGRNRGKALQSELKHLLENSLITNHN
jgi:hypothetical protein